MNLAEKKNIILKITAGLVAGFFGFTPGSSAADVVSYHNDQQSTGQNLVETVLTPSGFSGSSFGKRFSTPVDGQVYAQPLYKTGVNVVGGSAPGVHNVVFVATQHNSVYAIDAESGAVLWQTSLSAVSLGLPGATSVTTVPQPDVISTDITAEVGITSTPVIGPDPAAPSDGGRGWIYVVAKTKQIVNNLTSQPHYVFTLFALDIRNGAIAAKNIFGDTIYSGGNYIYRTGMDPYVVGTGGGNITVDGQKRVYLNSLRAHQRPGLLLYQGKIFMAFASHGTNGPYNGWVLGFDSVSLEPKAAFCVTPNGGGAGIWQAGGIICVDPQGYLYFVTGNGTFDGNATSGGIDAEGFPSRGDYGDCVLKVAIDETTSRTNQNINGWGLKVVDYFSPFNNKALDQADRDLGSSGLTILPDSAGSLGHPRLLVCGGKEGKFYLIDRDNMGKFNSTMDSALQVGTGVIQGVFGTPGYFDGKIYFFPAYNNDKGKVFSIGNAVMSSSPIASTPQTFGFPGCTPSISSNGSQNGIVWVIDNGAKTLRAYDASNFSSNQMPLLWASNQSAANSLGSTVKFTVPTVADGKVFVGTADALVAYGTPNPPTAPPASPSQLVASAISSTRIDLSWTDGATNEAGYLVEQAESAGGPFAQIASTGVNGSSYSVDGLQSGKIYYFRVRAFNAYQGGSYSAYSNVANATTILQSAPDLNFESGFADSGTLLNFNGSAGITGIRAHVTPRISDQSGSIWSKEKQDVRRFQTEFLFQITQAKGDGFTFCIQNNSNIARGGAGGSLGYAGSALNRSVAIKFDIYPGSSTTGLYTNGSSPGEDSASIDMKGNGVDIRNARPFSVRFTYDGTKLSQTVTDMQTNATFAREYTVDIPAILGGSGARTNEAYVGFTGGTGGDSALQQILEWTFTTLPVDPPGEPASLEAIPISGVEASLSWIDNSNNESGFKIERRVLPNGDFSEVGVAPVKSGVGEVTFEDEELSPGVSYEYRVRAINNIGASPYSNVAAVTMPVPPVTPSDAMVSLVGSTSLKLQWTDNSNNEGGYKIFRRQGMTGQFLETASLPSNTETYDDTGLLPGVTYDYHVQAFNIAGYSDFAGLAVRTLPRVSIASFDKIAQVKTSNTASFKITRTGETDETLPVQFVVESGLGQAAASRYELLPESGNINILEGQLEAQILVEPRNDMAVEGTKSVTLDISPSGSYEIGSSGTAQISLLDTPVNVWKISKFGSVALAQGIDAADSASPAGDGISNLVKYALDLSPQEESTAFLPYSAIETVGDQEFLTLSFTRPEPIPAEVSYVVEVSDDLMNWEPAAPSIGYPQLGGDGTVTIQYSDFVPQSASEKRFIRLRVTRF